MKILELPERAQQLIGDDVIPLAAIDQLRAIGTVAPDLLDAVIAYLDDGNARAAERLTREPGWVLDAARSHAGNGKVFAAYLHSASAHEIAELRLGKKTEQLYADAEKLHRQLDRYVYGTPQVRFTDDDVDQARAAGMLIEFAQGRPIIVDRPLYRELVKGAIQRTHDDLEAKAATAAEEKKTAGGGRAPADPVTVAKRERGAQLRELADQAHGASSTSVTRSSTTSPRSTHRHRCRAVLRPASRSCRGRREPHPLACSGLAPRWAGQERERAFLAGHVRVDVLLGEAAVGDPRASGRPVHT